MNALVSKCLWIMAAGGMVQIAQAPSDSWHYLLNNGVAVLVIVAGGAALFGVFRMVWPSLKDWIAADIVRRNKEADVRVEEAKAQMKYADALIEVRSTLEALKALMQLSLTRHDEMLLKLSMRPCQLETRQIPKSGGAT